MAKEEKNSHKLDQIKELLKDKKYLLIVMQDYPDPDALASAAALRELVRHYSDIQCTITSGGIIGRAENKALAKYLRLPYHIMQEIDVSKYDLIALVDTQTGTGNNSLPPDYEPHIIIDHHRIIKATRSARFTDIRNKYGAASTILYEYLKEAGVEIDAPLATALIYGIRSDTQDMGIDSSKADNDAYLALYPLANKRMLSEIQRSRTPRSYFAILATALNNAKVYEKAVLSCMGNIDIPDIVGEIADMTLRDEKTSWTLCYGFYEDQILLSIRTTESDADAGEVMQKIVSRKGTGGGHHAMAGGQLPLKKGTKTEREEMERMIRSRFLKALKITGTYGTPLIDDMDSCSILSSD